jgi:hypothetical protein
MELNITFHTSHECDAARPPEPFGVCGVPRADRTQERFICTQETLYLPPSGNIPENTKGAGGINSVSAFAFDGKSIVPLCKSVKGSCQGFTFFTTQRKLSRQKFGKTLFSAAH